MYNIIVPENVFSTTICNYNIIYIVYQFIDSFLFAGLTSSEQILYAYSGREQFQ
jgi:hypothetical protein